MLHDINAVHRVCTYEIQIVFLLTAVNCGTMRNATSGQVCHTARTTFRPTATYSCRLQPGTWEVVLAFVKLCKSGREVHLHAWHGVLLLPVNTLVVSKTLAFCSLLDCSDGEAGKEEQSSLTFDAICILSSAWL